MMRPLSQLEKFVLLELCGDRGFDSAIDAWGARSINEDETIVEIVGPKKVVIGSDVVELAQGLFETVSGAPACFVMLLGDELGNPRELDFHGLASGQSLASLQDLKFVAL